MRRLAFFLFLLSSLSVFATPQLCENVTEMVRNANESMSIMGRRRFGDAIKQSFKQVLDRGVKIDPGFFKSVRVGVGVKAKRFKLKTNKKGYDDSLSYHFDKHGKEFSPPMRSREEYLRRSKKFMAATNNDTLTIKSKGGVVSYNPKTKEFGAIGTNGDIVTYYIADLDYINSNTDLGPYKSIEEWIYNEKWRAPVLHDAE